MQNTGLDIYKMIKNNRISISRHFNKLSANLIYLNYSDPDFRDRNNIRSAVTANRLVNIDINLSVIAIYKESGYLYVNREKNNSGKKLNDFKIVTCKPNTYGSRDIEYKLNNLLQKIRKDEQNL